MAKILSIVCAYFPNNQRLSLLVNSLLSVGDVVVVNNGGAIELVLNSSQHQALVMDPGKNLGTLASYNFVISQKQEYSYYWLWDQDTEISADAIEIFLAKAAQLFDGDPTTVCATVFDEKNFVSPLTHGLVLAKASTSFVSRKRVQNLLSSWFDEKLFMDYGDWDLCYRLHKAGGRVCQVAGINVGHQLGEAEKTILGLINRPSPMRQHMQGINTVYLVKKNGFFNFLSFLLLSRIFMLPFKNLLFKGAGERNKVFLIGLLSGLRGGLSSTYASSLDKKMQ